MILNNKSQIFIFDMIFAFVIIIVGLSLIFMYNSNVDDNIDLYELNNNLLKGISNTKVNSLNDEEIRLMFTNNNIKNIENTVGQQIVEFYSNSQKELAQNLTRIFIEDYLDKQMNFNITIKDEAENIEVLFVKLNKKISFEDSSTSSEVKRSLFTFTNSTNFYGPYEFKIKIWK